MLNVWMNNRRTASGGASADPGACLLVCMSSVFTERPRNRKKTETASVVLMIISHNLGYNVMGASVHKICSIVLTVSTLNYFKQEKHIIP